MPTNFVDRLMAPRNDDQPQDVSGPAYALPFPLQQLLVDCLFGEAVSRKAICEILRHLS
jgi:hypothetical protein